EWYDNEDNPEDDKVFPVDCGYNKLINMTVDDIVEINMVKVSGTVKYEGESTDPDGTTPSAYVEFFPLSKDGGGANYGKLHAFVGRDGYYEIELPDMYDYKAAAYLYNAEDMNSGFVQYYNLKDNFEDADVIVLDSEKDDINFIFDEPEYKIASGKVTFKDGSPYAGAQVVFAYADNNKQMINIAVTDESGKYEIKLIADKKYIAYAYNRYDDYGKMNSVQYYNQADNIEDAEIIELIEDISGIDFVFSKPVLYKISGNVNYEDGSPVIGASVEFESIEGNESGSRYFMTGTRTDKEGKYEIELLEDIVGIILVHSFDSDFDKSGKALYYEQTYIRDEAEKFKINQDYTDIDFVLADPNGHTGEAHASAIVRVNNLQDEALTDVIVFAFKVGSDRNMDPDMYNGFSAAPNPDGEFMFRELALGEYVFFAFPMNGEYAPGLFKEGEQAVWSWEDATRVKLEADKKIYGPYTIILPLIDEIEGIAVLEGNISSGQVGIMEDAGDLSITGASVYLINASGSASKYVKSSSKGEFRITGIADGIYTLVVDKVGFKKYTQSVEIFNGESLAAEDSQEISLIPEITTSVEDETEFATSVNLYPNPTVDNVSISYHGVAGKSTVTVINSVGSELFSMTVNAVTGTNEHVFSSLNLASGLYYIKIVNGQSFKMIPLTVVR
nr:carboxypeptidase regulatory-like domain-containing protein [Candidatus Kapabacteria bacterium]